MGGSKACGPRDDFVCSLTYNVLALYATSPINALAIEYRFTGKERDSESGLDYFGARYYGSTMGRWLSPDWSVSPEPVPFSKLDNPQSLNLYGYVGNNPLSQKDDDGHEIIYVTSGPRALRNEQTVRDSVMAILDNPKTSANLSGYVGKENPNLVIMSDDLSREDTTQVNGDGTVTQTRVLGHTDGGGQTADGGPMTQGEASIVIDNRNTPENIPHTIVHESVHAGEARKDIAKFTRDARAEQANPNHDARPQEQRAIAADKAYGTQISKAVKQIEKKRKEGKTE